MDSQGNNYKLIGTGLFSSLGTAMCTLLIIFFAKAVFPSKLQVGAFSIYSKIQTVPSSDLVILVKLIAPSDAIPTPSPPAPYYPAPPPSHKMILSGGCLFHSADWYSVIPAGHVFLQPKWIPNLNWDFRTLIDAYRVSEALSLFKCCSVNYVKYVTKRQVYLIERVFV